MKCTPFATVYDLDMVNGEDDNQVMDEVSMQVHSTILSALGIQYAFLEAHDLLKQTSRWQRVKYKCSFVHLTFAHVQSNPDLNVPDRVIAASPCGRSFDGSLSTPEWDPFRTMGYGGPFRHKVKFVFCDSLVRLFIYSGV